MRVNLGIVRRSGDILGGGGVSEVNGDGGGRGDSLPIVSEAQVILDVEGLGV